MAKLFTRPVTQKYSRIEISLSVLSGIVFVWAYTQTKAREETAS